MKAPDGYKYCECDDFNNCDLLVEISEEEYMIISNANHFLRSKECKDRGVEYKLIEEKEKYNVFGYYDE